MAPPVFLGWQKVISNRVKPILADFHEHILNMTLYHMNEVTDGYF